MTSAPGLCEPGNFPECRAAVVLWKIFSPIFLIVGISGNILSMAVLSRQRMRQTTTSVYLRLLALVDFTVIVVGVPPHLMYNYAGLDIKNEGAFTCKFYSWLSPTVTALSWWMLPVITLDRFIMVKYPVWAKNHSTKRSAVVLVLILAATISVLNSHHLIFLSTSETRIPSNFTNATVTVTNLRCDPNPQWYKLFYHRVWPIVILILYNIAPVTFLIICNLLLIIELIKRSRQNQTRRAKGGDNVKDSRATKSIMKMLTTVCIIFLITSSPMCLNLVITPYIFDRRSKHDAAKMLLIQSVAQLLMYSNNTINFLLYTLSGKVFRNEFRAMFEQCRQAIVTFRNRSIYPVGHTGDRDLTELKSNVSNILQDSAATKATRLG